MRWFSLHCCHKYQLGYLAFIKTSECFLAIQAISFGKIASYCAGSSPAVPGAAKLEAVVYKSYLYLCLQHRWNKNMENLFPEELEAPVESNVVCCLDFHVNELFFPLETHSHSVHVLWED